MTELITRFVDLPIDTKVALIAFLKADYIPVLYFNNDHSASSTGEERTTSKESKSSLSRKLIHQMSHLSGRNAHSEDTVEKKKKPMVVQVSRNSSMGSVKFDVSI
jgi:hypothetical protein